MHQLLLHKIPASRFKSLPVTTTYAINVPAPRLMGDVEMVTMKPVATLASAVIYRLLGTALKIRGALLAGTVCLHLVPRSIFDACL